MKWRFAVSIIAIVVLVQFIAPLPWGFVPQAQAIFGIDATIQVAADVFAAAAKEAKQTALALAFKNALRFFLRTLAYDTATYIATGDKGEAPLLFTEGWGEYLKNVGSGALGEFVDTVGQEWAYDEENEIVVGEEKIFDEQTGITIRRPIKKNVKTEKKLGLNLCNPSPSIKARITLGLIPQARPAPRCEFFTMVKNWEQAVTRPDFLPKLEDMFSPYGNELGISLTLQTGLGGFVDQKIQDATNTRRDGPFKDVTDSISGIIKTPGKVLEGVVNKSWVDSNKPELIFTGTLADALDVFTQTLLGKLFEKWIKGGMIGKYKGPGYRGINIPGFAYGNDFDTPGSGIAAAREQYASL